MMRRRFLWVLLAFVGVIDALAAMGPVDRAMSGMLCVQYFAKWLTVISLVVSLVWLGFAWKRGGSIRCVLKRRFFRIFALPLIFAIVYAVHSMWLLGPFLIMSWLFVAILTGVLYMLQERNRKSVKMFLKMIGVPIVLLVVTIMFDKFADEFNKRYPHEFEYCEGWEDYDEWHAQQSRYYVLPFH